jgi:hypothetical protein
MQRYGGTITEQGKYCYNTVKLNDYWTTDRI